MANPTVKSGIVGAANLAFALFVSDTHDEGKGAWDAKNAVHHAVIGTPADLTAVACGTSGRNGLRCAPLVDTGVALQTSINQTTSLYETSLNGSFTVSALVRLNAGETGGCVVFANRDGWSPNNGFQFGVTGDGRIFAQRTGPGLYGETNAAVVARDELVCVTVVWDDATGQLLFYKNGTLVKTNTGGTGGPITWTGASARRARLFDGNERTGAGYQAAGGQVFGVLLWTTILSAANIQTFGTSEAALLSGAFHTAAFDFGAAAPVITGPAGAPGAASISVNVAENATAIGTWTADAGDTWSIAGGADASHVTISAGGAVTFLAAKNYEAAPDDADANRIYVFIVQRSGTSGTSQQTVNASLTDVAEPAVFSGPLTVPSLTQGVAMSNINVDALWAPVDAGDVGTYTLLGGPIPGLSLSSNGTTFGGSPSAGGTFANRQIQRLGANGLLTYSNVFTVTVAGTGNQPPSDPGPVGISSVTSASFNFSFGASTDDVGVVGYKYQINDEPPVDIGLVLSGTVTGRTPGEVINFAVWGYDAEAAEGLSRFANSFKMKPASVFSATAGPLYFTTGSGPQLSKTVHWTFFPAALTGGLTGADIAEGTTVSDPTTGEVTVVGLPVAGAGELWMRDEDGGRYFESVVAA